MSNFENDTFVYAMDKMKNIQNKISISDIETNFYTGFIFKKDFKVFVVLPATLSVK